MSKSSDEPTNGHPLGGAICDALSWYNETKILPQHRRYLSRELQGTILDLGAGTGPMFPYFGAAAQRHGPLQLYGIEPNLHMKARAEQKAGRVGLDISLRSARAESLPYKAESFDTVIASLVFCTIPDVEQALQEIDRVLKPNGELRFVEHVRSDGKHGEVQDRIAPIWKRIAGGCHLNRRTGRTFANSQFELAEIEEITLDTRVSPTKRLIRGTIRKPD